ncbi:MAG: hypothetical protein KDB37_21345 [Ilumatobacter sp.]|nr:hypothetical protein [Ilumatobacter sp.]
MTACSLGDDEAAPTTTESVSTTTPETTTAPSTTTAPTTTTTEAPTTTATPTTTEPPPTTTEPPPTTNPGDPDWLTIAQDLLNTLYELRADPDVDRIEEFCLGGENPCQEIQGNEITQLENEGWVVVGMENPTVIRAELLNSTEGVPEIARQYLVQVEIEPEDLSAAAIVDGDGNVISTIEADPDNPAEVLNMLLMKAGPDWRVVGISGPTE